MWKRLFVRGLKPRSTRKFASLRTSQSRNLSSSFPRRSVLYLPANNLKFAKKATTLDLDTVVLDLEDAIAPSAKDEARKSVLQILDAQMFRDRRTEVCVRINSLSSGLAESDLKAVLSASVKPDSICLPKCESGSDIEWLSSSMDEAWGSSGQSCEIIGMIESPSALVNAREICSAAPQRLSAIIFGGDDYAQSMNAIRSKSNSELWFARNAVLTQAKASGLQCIDIVYINYKSEDPSEFEDECTEGFNLGFVGKQLIHPNQISECNRLFTPSEETIQWAVRVCDSFERSAREGIGAFELDGHMIDMPTVKQAENIVRRARKAGVI